MGKEIAIIERQLQSVEPQLHNALAGSMKVKQLIQTALISCERSTKLMECTPQSIMNGVMTFAVLGLPVDGATGQGFLMPFKDTRKNVSNAQAVIGYKGYNTLGARARLTITGGAVREDDEAFDFMLGDRAFVKHKPKLGSQARIVAFWACAASHDRPPIISVLSIDDVLAIKAKSPAVRFNAQTPWTDSAIGFPAMGEKSAKRRLARSTPLIIDAPQFMMAARMEEAFDEQGIPSRITPDRGVVLDGEIIPGDREPSPTPTAEELLSPRPTGDRAADQAAPAHITSPTPAAGAAEVQEETDSERISRLDIQLAAAAEKGWKVLATAWDSISEEDGAVLGAALTKRYEPRALEVDRARKEAADA